MKKEIVIGFLTIIIVSSAFYIALDNVKFRVDNEYGKLYGINENNRWILIGAERTQLFDGTSRINRKLAQTYTNWEQRGDLIYFIRNTQYRDNIKKVDTYVFDSQSEDIEKLPLSHRIDIYNASGKFLRYEVDGLYYSGDQYKLTGETTLSFDYNTKVDLHPNYRWAWVYKKGKVTAQYDIDSDHETYYFRLYDPTATTTTLYIEESSADVWAEHNVTLQIKANLTQSGSLLGTSDFCIDFGMPISDVCDDDLDGVIEYNLTPFATITKFNDSTTSKNFTGVSNVSYFEKMHSLDVVFNGTVDFYGYNNSGYPNDVEIDVGSNGADTILYGELVGNVLTENTFNGSLSSIELDWESVGGTKRRYVRVTTGVNASHATLNITANPNGNATVTEMTFDWRYGINYGGYGFSVGDCFAMSSGVIGDRIYFIGGQCIEPSTAYNNTIYYDVTNDDFYSSTDLPYDAYSSGFVTEDSNDDGSGDTIYIIGGYDSGDNAINKTYKFNGATWSELTEMPDARGGIATVLVNKTIYVFGGENATVLKYNITTNSWSEGGDIGDSDFILSQAAQYNSTHILHWGGYGNVDIDWYDMTSDTFTDTGNNEPQYGAIGVSFRKYDGTYEIYQIGGYYNSWTGKIERFNPTTESFDRVSPDFDFTSSSDTIYRSGWSVFEGSIYAASNTGLGYDSNLFRLEFFPQNPYIIVGSGSNNVTWEWNESYYDIGMTSYQERGSDAQGITQFESNVGDFSTELNNYVATCTGIYCDVPIYIYSGSAGNLTVQDLNITWITDNVDINATSISVDTDWDNESINVSSAQGMVQISDLNIWYWGSNNFTINATYSGNATYDPSSDSQLMRIVFSNVTLDETESYGVVFPPISSTEENTTPYGQSSSTPSWNITSRSYAKNTKIRVKVNESYDSCINITISNTSSKDNGIVLTNTSQFVSNIEEYPSGFSGFWFWVDTDGCNTSEIRYVAPTYLIDTCCDGCVECDW